VQSAFSTCVNYAALMIAQWWLRRHTGSLICHQPPWPLCRSNGWLTEDDTAWLLDTWSTSADLSTASTATNISGLQLVVNWRFHGSGCQPTEAVFLDTPVHLLGTLCRTFLNATRTLSTFRWHLKHFLLFVLLAHWPCFLFEVATVNMLYKLHTYLTLWVP